MRLVAMKYTKDSVVCPNCEARVPIKRKFTTKEHRCPECKTFFVEHLRFHLEETPCIECKKLYPSLYGSCYHPCERLVKLYYHATGITPKGEG